MLLTHFLVAFLIIVSSLHKGKAILVYHSKGKQSEIASTSSACERVIDGKKVENGGN
jgi:hypothetical protein